MRIGFIGAGLIGGGLARLAAQAGHDVLVSNSRTPKSLFSLLGQIGERARGGTPTDAAHFGELVVVAIPFDAYRELPVEALAGKVVLETTNYFAARDGAVPEIDTGRTTSSELIARHLAKSHVVKGFNTIPSTDLAAAGEMPGIAARRAVPIAGDDDGAKQIASSFIRSIGFDVVDAGPLAAGRKLEVEGTIFGVRLDADAVKKALAGAG